MKFLLAPLSWLYAFGVWVRNVLYDDRVLPSHKVDIPTIAIGNLADRKSTRLNSSHNS